MYAIAWLLFWLGIILSPLSVIWFMPLFIGAIFTVCLADSDWNYRIIALMGVLHAAWFGYDPVILMIVMLAMLSAYWGQEVSKFPAMVVPLLAVSYVAVHGAINMVLQPELRHPLTIAVLAIRLMILWFFLRFMERKAGAQYV